jgi:hypothetical protein
LARGFEDGGDYLCGEYSARFIPMGSGSSALVGILSSMLSVGVILLILRTNGLMSLVNTPFPHTYARTRPATSSLRRRIISHLRRQVCYVDACLPLHRRTRDIGSYGLITVFLYTVFRITSGIRPSLVTILFGSFAIVITCKGSVGLVLQIRKGMTKSVHRKRN